MASNRQTRARVHSIGTTATEEKCSNVANESGYGKSDEAASERQIDFSKLTFKELLAACPIEGIELTRADDLPRATNI